MIAGILYLQSSNFGIDQIPKGKVICNSIKGFSVVLFYSSTKCKYSPYALQEFKKASSGVNGVIFGVIDIDRNMDTVRQSRRTLTPIDGVPYIMLYLDGVPRQIYPEEYPFTAKVMHEFVASVTGVISRASKNVQRPAQPQKKKPFGSTHTISYLSNVRRKNITYIDAEK